MFRAILLGTFLCINVAFMIGCDAPVADSSDQELGFGTMDDDDSFSSSNASRPHILLIHGIGDIGAMDNLRQFLTDRGSFDDIHIKNHLEPLGLMTLSARTAAKAGQPIVIMGHSQGGFQAIKAADELINDKIGVKLVVSMAAGGAGRAVPAQWGFDPRPIPRGIVKYFNFFALNDNLGTDDVLRDNYAYGKEDSKEKRDFKDCTTDRRVNNCLLSSSEVNHFNLPRCHSDSAPRSLMKLVCEPLLTALRSL